MCSLFLYKKKKKEEAADLSSLSSVSGLSGHSLCIKSQLNMDIVISVQFSSFAQSCPTLCNPINCSSQASLSITNSWSLLKLMSLELVMSFNHLLLCHPLLLLPSIFPNIRVFTIESALRIRWPEYWSFSFSIIPSNEHPGQISFRMDWLDLLNNSRDSQESSPTPQFKSINSSALSFLNSPTLISIHDYWKNDSLD